MRPTNPLLKLIDLKAVIDANSGPEFSAFAGKQMQLDDGPTRQAAVDRGNKIVTHLENTFSILTEEAGHDRVVCEVNLDPPNPGSDAFHERLGFRVVDEQDTGDKRVALMVRENADSGESADSGGPPGQT